MNTSAAINFIYSPSFFCSDSNNIYRASIHIWYLPDSNNHNSKDSKLHVSLIKNTIFVIETKRNLWLVVCSHFPIN